MKVYRFLPAVLAVCILAVMPATADNAGPDPDLQYETRVEWESLRIMIHLSGRIPDEASGSPMGGMATERRLERALPDLLLRTLSGLVIESSMTLGTLLGRDPALAGQMRSLSRQMRREGRRFSSDLTRVHIEYSLPIFPYLSDLVYTHRTPFPVPRTPEWFPSHDYTGIVIYAADTVPVHGEDVSATVQPALYPRILDSRMQVVLDRTMMAPSFLSRWGVAGYSTTTDEIRFIDRVGPRPLRIMATGVFGTHRTDPVISDEAAGGVLFTENGRRLLREGRVVIIVAPDQIDSVLSR